MGYMVTEDETVSDEEIVGRKEFDMLLGNIKDYRAGIQGELIKIDGSLTRMWQKIDGRPSWAVLVIITLLTSLVVGLTVGILK